jgi:hypothetical protein
MKVVPWPWPLSTRIVPSSSEVMMFYAMFSPSPQPPRPMRVVKNRATICSNSAAVRTPAWCSSSPFFKRGIVARFGYRCFYNLPDEWVSTDLPREVFSASALWTK